MLSAALKGLEDDGSLRFQAAGAGTWGRWGGEIRGYSNDFVACNIRAANRSEGSAARYIAGVGGALEVGGAISGRIDEGRINGNRVGIDAREAFPGRERCAADNAFVEPRRRLRGIITIIIVNKRRGWDRGLNIGKFLTSRRVIEKVVIRGLRPV